MSHYLKKILFALLIFMMPYMNSTSQAMIPEDYQEDTIRYRQKSLKTEASQDITKQATSLRRIEERSQASWRPSPGLKITIFGCLFMACQVLAVTAEYYCSCLPNRQTSQDCLFLGSRSNASCVHECALNKRQAYSW